MNMVKISPSIVVALDFNFSVMPIRICRFNPKEDKKAVQPGAAIDLKSAFKNGTLPAFNADTPLTGNSIVEPGAVMDNADDVFDMYRQSDSVRNYKPDDDTKD